MNGLGGGRAPRLYLAWRQTQCGYVIAPLDYANPQGTTIALGVFRAKRVPSNSGADQHMPAFTNKGSLFVNPGGPGGDSLAYAASLAESHLTVRLDENDRPIPDPTYAMFGYEIVGVSARGTRFSLPSIVCESAEADRARSAATLTTAEQKAWEAWRANECRTNSVRQFPQIDGRAFLDHAGDIDTARDMDLVRSILGNEKLDYYGVSYGTKLGYQYSKLFPGRLNSIVLDSSENQFEMNLDDLAPYASADYVPTTPLSRTVQQRLAIEETFRHYLAQCLSGRYGTCPLANPSDPVAPGGTPTAAQIDDAYARYQSVTLNAVSNTRYFRYFVAGPTDSTAIDRPVPFAELTQGVMYAMYAEWRWQQLTDGLTSLMSASRDATKLLDMSDAYAGRRWDSTKKTYTYTTSTPGVFPTLRCIDTTTNTNNGGLTSYDGSSQLRG